MSFTAISGTPPQYQKSDGTLASDYYLKFYQSGTTTAFNMATNSSGSTLLSKAKINSAGYPVNESDDVFIPHVNQAYKIVLYKNSTDADNNTTANAVWVVDQIDQNASALSPDIEHQLGSAAASKVFTISSFTYTLGDNKLFVYQNGQLLRKGASFDYTETTTSTVTISSGKTVAPDDTFLFLKLP